MAEYKIKDPDGITHTVTAPDGADENSILGFAHTVLSGVKDAINRGTIGGLVGAPVDIANSALKPFGLGSDKPVMGSEWIGDKMQQAGMVSNQRNSIAEGLASFIDPATMGAGAAKLAAGIPAIAGMVKGMGKAEDALMANPAHGVGGLVGTTALPHWVNTFLKHGGEGDIDESLNIPAKSQAFADMAEKEGFTVAGRGDKYVTLTKSFGTDPDGYDKLAVVKARISDHSNVNRSHHFGDVDINIAPDDGYARHTFDEALQKLRSVYVDDELSTLFKDAGAQE